MALSFAYLPLGRDVLSYTSCPEPVLMCQKGMGTKFNSSVSFPINASVWFFCLFFLLLLTSLIRELFQVEGRTSFFLSLVIISDEELKIAK